MNNNNKLLWIVAALLLAVGVFQPSLPRFNNSSSQAVSVSVPSDELQSKCEKIIQIVKSSNNSGKTEDMRKLSGLYLDLARLISINDEDTIIKNTEEVREANKLSGKMLELDIKDKYEDLGEELNSVVKSYLGDDNVALSPELRQRSVDVFKAFAWALTRGI
jgi:hypothetical protein